MESAVLTGAVSTLFTPSADALPRGRFSTGLERTPEASAACRVGRFSDGVARPHAELPLGRFSDGVAHAHAELPLGRFSTGVEQHREAPSHTRVGGFADGCEQLAPARPGAR